MKRVKKITLLLINLSLIYGAFGKHSIQKRVVMGRNAPITPYQVSLQTKAKSAPGLIGSMLQLFAQENEEWTHFCGGSIISDLHILTAAHCVSGFKSNDLSIYCGSTSRKKNGARHFISMIIVHPGYKELVKDDIALLKLQEKLVFSKRIQPIKYDPVFIEPREKCTLTGWGYTLPVRAGSLPEYLQTTTLTVISNQKCQKTYKNVMNNEICTSTSISNGACGGDSGGPVVCRNILAGAVSYGVIFCGSSKPDVHTRVGNYIPWIEENMLL